EAEARAVAFSLDLVESRARIQSALESLGLARSRSWAQLDLGVVGQHDADGAWGFGPEISTSLPVFDQGQARRAEADAVLRERMAGHVARTVEVRSAARLLLDRAATLRERALSLRDAVVPLRERLVKETLSQYNAM